LQRAADDEQHVRAGHHDQSEGQQSERQQMSGRKHAPSVSTGLTASHPITGRPQRAMSAVGNTAPKIFPQNLPNDGISLYGNRAKFRLCPSG
jgi:hypothetical protein